MPLGSTFWAYIAPVEKTNLLLNPSFERGTSGVAAIQGATIGSVANKQQFGAWSCAVTPSSNGTSGGAFGTWTAGNGTDYTVSAYVNGVNGVAYMIGVGDSSGVNLVGSTALTGGGTWQRYQYSYSESSGATRRPVIRKTSGNDTGTYYVDGVQVEVGSITTYLDGDQEGCIWLGAPHASQSTRSGQSRAGGSVIALADIGFTVSENPGIGMPQVENSAQSFAIVPGAEFQRQRARERVFTLSSYLSGTTYEDLHQQRKAAINAFNIDAFTPQQPTRFLYTGGMGTVQIDAVYSGGLEFGKPDGFTEVVSAQFVAYDPFWRGVTDEGTSLAPRVNLGSANFIAKRDSLGRWGTLGATGSTIQNESPNGGIRTMLYTNGTLFIGGQWGSVAGTVFPNIAMYYPNSNTFGTLTGGTLQTGGIVPNNRVRALAISPAGSLYAAGDIVLAGGTQARMIAQWNGAWGSLPGGTIFTGRVNALAQLGGTLVTAGSFAAVNGTLYPHIAQWANATWGTLVGGTISDEIRALAVGRDQKLFMGGDFLLVGGTTANNIGFWAGAFGTMGAGAPGGNVFALAIEPNGKLIAAGKFLTLGGGSALDVGEWNGVQWAALGSGLTTSTGGSAQMTGAFADQRTGDVYVGGQITLAGGLRTPDGIARWNGYTWLPLDIDITTAIGGTIHCIAQAPDRTLYIAGTWSGTAQAAAVAQIINTGGAPAYPTFVARNTGGGTARLYQLLNTTTGDELHFDYALQPGEQVTVDLTPGKRSFTSDYQGDIFGAIVPGSNIATWKLLRGTNYVSLFADSDSLVSSFYWRPLHAAGDSGTVY